MKLSKTLLTALFLAVCAAPAPAAWDWDAPRAVHYITAEQSAGVKLPPPPAAGSKEDKADLAEVRAWEKKRAAAQCEKARTEKDADFEGFFGDISPLPRPLPKEVSEIFFRLIMDTNDVCRLLKDLYARPRPRKTDPALKPCLKAGADSYPSGHAAISRICALTLSDLVPARRAEFMARADEAALRRVIVGVHYPSDLAAGKRLADILYPIFLKSPAFRKDLEILRGYLKPAPAPSLK